MRVISRLVGGSSIQAISLTRSLQPAGYRTTLVTGSAGSEEGTMAHLAEELAVQPVILPALRRSLGPHDLRAIAAMRSLLRRERPEILHTHAAKGGAVGRSAALTLRRRPAVLVHTFHGHVLRGYFGPAKTAAFSRIERRLARYTTAIVAVAPEVKDELVELGVAPPGKIEVVPLGFDLTAFDASAEQRQRARVATRARFGIEPTVPLVTLIARLVPIKRVDRFLRAATAIAERLPDARYLVVGDGELGPRLRRDPAALALGSRLAWAGFDADMPSICFASDVVALTSDNEGTPVSVIEAHAAGVPAVSTDVGGVRQVIDPGESGYLVAADDERGFAEATAALLSSPERARAMGARGRERVRARFTLERLTDDLDRLYRDLLGHVGRSGSRLDPPRPVAAG